MTSYVLKFADDLRELIQAAAKTRDMLDAYTMSISRDHSEEPLSHGAAWDAARALDAALEPFEEPTAPQVAPAVEEPQESAQSPTEACQGFQSWGGVSVDCERCDRPAWEHAGQETRGANPFDDEGVEVVPWSGQMARVREHHLKGGVVSVREDGSGGKIIQLLPSA